MKIATFNVNSVRSREQILLDWIRENSPDILCLQETKVPDESFPLDVFRKAGYSATYRGEKSYNGVAILSRKLPGHLSFGFNKGQASDETRVQRADFDGFTVVNTYVPQGRSIDHPMYRHKLDWLKKLRAWFDENFKKNDKVIWVGDMNVARTHMDVHNPEERDTHVCYHEDARKAFEHCIEWGFEDVFRKFHPDPGHYTFFDYRNPQNVRRRRGWRVDYILASRPAIKTAKDAWIDLGPRLQSKPSDHTVLVSEFDL